VVFPADAVRIEGTPKWFESLADSGAKVRRGFCGECGSPLFSTNDRASFLAVKVGSLDDPSTFRPQVEVWTSSAQPWAHLDPTVPHFPKNRTRPG
jgi:hypothetical protein